MLAAEGLGCNLQQYNLMVDARVSEEWDIPAAWTLKAQLVFGTPAGPVREGPSHHFGERVFAYATSMHKRDGFLCVF